MSRDGCTLEVSVEAVSRSKHSVVIQVADRDQYRAYQSGASYVNMSYEKSGENMWPWGDTIPVVFQPPKGTFHLLIRGRGGQFLRLTAFTLRCGP